MHATKAADKSGFLHFMRRDFQGEASKAFKRVTGSFLIQSITFHVEVNCTVFNGALTALVKLLDAGLLFASWIA